MKKFLRDNSLALAFATGFLATLIAQAFAGQSEFNTEQRTAGLAEVSFAHYISSAAFAVEVVENWQSEYLQFFVYAVGTVWLVQRGSPESKNPQESGRQSDEEQLVGAYAQADSPRWARVGGWRTALYSRSLGLTVLAIFVLSWAAQSLAGWVAYNEQRLSDLQSPLSWFDYMHAADFWHRTMQNWQSELLAVGSFAVFAIYLRERGSPESKQVGAPHQETDTQV